MFLLRNEKIIFLVRTLNYSCAFTSYIILLINPLYTGKTETGTFTNSEDTDKILRNVAFHQDLQCL